MVRKIITLLLLLGIVYNWTRSYGLFEPEKIYRHRLDFNKIEDRYFKSQWVIPESKHPVGDDILYIYAGVKYLRGTDPSLLVAEHPPLGKNLVGLSALYLGNEYYFSLLSGIFALITFYLLAKSLTGDKRISLLLTVFLGLEPLIVANYFLALFDLLMLGFLNLFFYFLITANDRNSLRNMFLANLVLGLIISTKFFGLMLPVLGAALLYLAVSGKPLVLAQYILALPVAFIVYAGSYFQYFLKGHSPLEFLKLQKWIYVFHTEGRKAFLGLNGSLPLLLFRGRFYTDTVRTVRENHHSLVWAISSLALPVALPFRIKSVLAGNRPLLLPLLWLGLYGLMQLFSFTNARYLILMLPYIYLSLTALLLVSGQKKDVKK